jgi:hypothetical protein
MGEAIEKIPDQFWNDALSVLLAEESSIPDDLIAMICNI